MPKVQAASRTLLTHLRFDPGEARRCCLDFHIFDLKNTTPAAFQESALPVIRLMAGKGGTLQFPGSDQGWELLTLRQTEPEFPLSAALHNHSYYSSARGPQQGECCANRAPAPALRDRSLQARQSRHRGRAGMQKTEWLWELWVMGGERDKDEASSPFKRNDQYCLHRSE